MFHHHLHRQSRPGWLTDIYDGAAWLWWKTQNIPNTEYKRFSEPDLFDCAFTINLDGFNPFEHTPYRFNSNVTSNTFFLFFNLFEQNHDQEYLLKRKNCEISADGQVHIYQCGLTASHTSTCCCTNSFPRVFIFCVSFFPHFLFCFYNQSV